MEIWPSDTHYMLVQLRMGKAAALKEYLATEQGILIRDASNFEGLNEHFFRIATQTPEENDKLVAEALLTEEVRNRIAEADYVFGAKRMVESIKKWTYMY